MAVAAAISSPSSEPDSRWIGSPGWDLFWMFSAFWAAALMLVGTGFGSVAEVALVMFAANVLLSFVHSWSTTYMVLGSPLFASVRAADRRRYRIVPACIVSGSLLLGTYVGFVTDGALPWERGGFQLYIALFWVGHFWHFGQQDFGVLSLYRLRAGQSRPLDRKIDRAYTALMMFVLQPIAVVNMFSETAVAGVFFDTAPISAGSVHSAAAAIIPLATLLFVAVVAFELSKRNRSIPKLLYYTVIFVHPVFVQLLAVTENQSFLSLYIITYLWSHWFIAIGLVSRVGAGHLESEGKPRHRAWLGHGMTVTLIALSFYLIEANWLRFELFRTTEYRSVLHEIGQSGDSLLIGFMLGFLLADQLLHYYCDRCMFRFRDPAVREKVAPLLLRA